MASGRVPAASDPSLATAVVASSPLATIVLEGSRRVIGFNAAAERLTGRSAASVLDRPAAELFAADDTERCLALLEAAGGSGDDHVEMVLRTEDGRGVLAGISWAPLFQDGHPTGLVGVGRDVAHRKRLEHEATRLAESFRALAEGSDLGLYRFSFLPHLRVDYVNPYLATIIGVSSEELSADPAPLWERLDATTRAGLDHARRGGEVDWPLLGTWRHPDGHLVELEFREAPLYDVAGRLESVLGMVRDMTGQRRQEQALAAALDLERAATDRLRRVDELRKVFLQAVSHELRTPLTAVLGFSATLRDRVAELPAARAAAMADRVHRQAGRIQRLLDDLLDVDRLSRGVLTLTRTPVDLGTLVQRVAAELGDDQLVIDAPSCTLAVDPLKIERIVVNLLVNARRHAGPAADVRLSLRPGDDDVRLVVEDDGPGVPEDQWRTVFEPFAQGPTAEGAASPGTGIGLTLVAAFSELHGGRAWVERSELGGARFVVALPRS